MIANTRTTAPIALTAINKSPIALSFNISSFYKNPSLANQMSENADDLDGLDGDFESLLDTLRDIRDR